MDDLKKRVAEACRVLGTLELTKAATGHVSARIPGTDRLLIRARGPGEMGVRYTEMEQVIEVDLNGRLTESAHQSLDVPIEVFIHTALYKARPEVSAVVHVHPPTVVLFTICDKQLQPLYGAYDPPGAAIAINGIPTYDRSILISTPGLGDDLSRVMGQAPVCLMRGHGITAVGPSVEEAALNAIYLNELAEMNYRASLLGEPRPISVEDQETFLKLGVESQRSSVDGHPSERATALWRYYRALTGNCEPLRSQ